MRSLNELNEVKTLRIYYGLSNYISKENYLEITTDEDSDLFSYKNKGDINQVFVDEGHYDNLKRYEEVRTPRDIRISNYPFKIVLNDINAIRDNKIVDPNGVHLYYLFDSDNISIGLTEVSKMDIFRNRLDTTKDGSLGVVSDSIRFYHPHVGDTNKGPNKFVIYELDKKNRILNVIVLFCKYHDYPLYEEIVNSDWPVMIFIESLGPNEITLRFDYFKGNKKMSYKYNEVLRNGQYNSIMSQEKAREYYYGR